jgi:hypothetical protein
MVFFHDGTGSYDDSPDHILRVDGAFPLPDRSIKNAGRRMTAPGIVGMDFTKSLLSGIRKKWLA